MNTTAQVKQQIQKSAQQMADEPLELLRSAARQVMGAETPSSNNGSEQQEQPRPDGIPQEEIDRKKQVAEQDGRHLEALESELKDIRRQKIYMDLMKRIENGEDIPLESFTELSYEQREVLKAQQEAYKNRNLNAPTNQLIEPVAAKGRRMMGGGQKQSAQKQTTRVEKPVPPSG